MYLETLFQFGSVQQNEYPRAGTEAVLRKAFCSAHCLEQDLAHSRRSVTC